MGKITAIILLIGILLTAGFVYAQDDETPIVTATVAVETANVRWMPETYFEQVSDIDSRIGELHAGDRLILHTWESVADSYTGNDDNWLYITHPESGVSGWIRADLLNVESDNWRAALPEIRTWTALSAFVAETAPNGLQAWVTWSGGGYDRLNVRAEPYSGGQKIGEIFPDSTVTILGRAMTNDVPLVYVYVRDNNTGVEGWVLETGLFAFGLRSVSRNPGLPVLYEVHTAGLPIFYVSDFNLRDGPGLEARVRREVFNPERFAATGRSADSQWVKVTDISSGEVGWIAVSVIAPGLLDVASLPVVE